MYYKTTQENIRASATGVYKADGAHTLRITYLCVPTKQGLSDLAPLFLQGTSRGNLSRPAVPVLRIGRITLFSMKVGVNPGTRRTFVLLRRLVPSRPVSLGIPPQPT